MDSIAQRRLTTSPGGRGQGEAELTGRRVRSSHHARVLLSIVALLPLLILSASAAGQSTEVDARHPDAVEVFKCGFDRRWDLNYDGWPDQWQRQLGADLPHYVPVE